MSEKSKIYKLSEEELDVMIERSAKRALEKQEEEREASARKSYDDRLYQTEFLLKHYREMKANTQLDVEELTEKHKEYMLDIQELMTDYLPSKFLKVENIKKSVANTKGIYLLIDDAIDIFTAMMYKSGNSTKIRRAKMLIDYIIAPVPCTHDDLSDKYFISKSVVNDDLKYCYNKISAILFGVNALNKKTEQKPY